MFESDAFGPKGASIQISKYGYPPLATATVCVQAATVCIQTVTKRIQVRLGGAQGHRPGRCASYPRDRRARHPD